MSFPADAPQLDPDEKHLDLVDHLIKRADKREFTSGMRALALHNFCSSTFSRADEARSKLICQQVPFDYPPVPDTIGCQQPLQTVLLSMVSGKTNAGDTKEYRVAPRHKDVRTTLFCLFLLFSTPHHISSILAHTQLVPCDWHDAWGNS